jgi:hypothetical protein
MFWSAWLRDGEQAEGHYAIIQGKARAGKADLSRYTGCRPSGHLHLPYKLDLSSWQRSTHRFPWFDNLVWRCSCAKLVTGVSDEQEGVDGYDEHRKQRRAPRLLHHLGTWFSIPFLDRHIFGYPTNVLVLLLEI